MIAFGDKSQELSRDTLTSDKAGLQTPQEVPIAERELKDDAGARVRTPAVKEGHREAYSVLGM